MKGTFTNKMKPHNRSALARQRPVLFTEWCTSYQMIPSDGVWRPSASAAKDGVESSTVSTSMWSQPTSSIILSASTSSLTSSRQSADDFVDALAWSTSIELAQCAPTIRGHHGDVDTSPSRHRLSSTNSSPLPLLPPPPAWNSTHPSNGITRKCVIGVSGRGRTGYSGGGNDVMYGEGQRWKGYGSGARNAEGGGCSVGRGSSSTPGCTQEVEHWSRDVDACHVTGWVAPVTSLLSARLVTSRWPSLSSVNRSSSSTLTCFAVCPSPAAASSVACLAVNWCCVLPPSCDDDRRCSTVMCQHFKLLHV